MTEYRGDRPVFMLVDDQIHAARLLSRTLANAPVPAQLVWIGNAERATRTLRDIVERRRERLPDMLIVDLKTDAGATATFIASVRNLMARQGISIVAITESLDAPLRNEVLDAGAAAVFQRHADWTAYREEMAQLTSFWVRETLTWPIRA